MDNPQSTPERTFLTVPFEQRTTAKKVGCRWDATAKQWFAPNADVARRVATDHPDWVAGSVDAQRAQEKREHAAARLRDTGLDVPFDEKDAAKEEGLRWNPERKHWFAPDTATLRRVKRKHPGWVRGTDAHKTAVKAGQVKRAQEHDSAVPQAERDARVYLRVPFDEKDKAKALGCRWDGVRRQWFAPDSSVGGMVASDYPGWAEMCDGAGTGTHVGTQADRPAADAQDEPEPGVEDDEATPEAQAAMDADDERAAFERDFFGDDFGYDYDDAFE